MSCDEFSLSNDCCASSDSTCSNNTSNGCKQSASSFQRCDDSDSYEDRLWVF